MGFFRCRRCSASRCAGCWMAWVLATSPSLEFLRPIRGEVRTFLARLYLACGNASFPVHAASVRVDVLYFYSSSTNCKASCSSTETGEKKTLLFEGVRQAQAIWVRCLPAYNTWPHPLGIRSPRATEQCGCGRLSQTTIRSLGCSLPLAFALWRNIAGCLLPAVTASPCRVLETRRFFVSTNRVHPFTPI